MGDTAVTLTSLLLDGNHAGRGGALWPPRERTPMLSSQRVTFMPMLPHVDAAIATAVAGIPGDRGMDGVMHGMGWEWVELCCSMGRDGGEA
jgi:hypothetical protein